MRARARVTSGALEPGSQIEKEVRRMRQYGKTVTLYVAHTESHL
jgi:hypothetical protein